MRNRRKIAAVLLVVVGTSVPCGSVTPALAAVDVGEGPPGAEAPGPAQDDHLTQASTPDFEEPEGQPVSASAGSSSPASSPASAAASDPEGDTVETSAPASASASATEEQADGSWSDTSTWAQEDVSVSASAPADQSVAQEDPASSPGSSSSASASPEEAAASSDTPAWVREAQPATQGVSDLGQDIASASASATPIPEEPVPAAEPTSPAPDSRSDAAGWGTGPENSGTGWGRESEDEDWPVGEEPSDGAAVTPEPDNADSWSATVPASASASVSSGDDGAWSDTPNWAREESEPPTKVGLDAAFGNDPDYRDYGARRQAAEEARPWSDTETWAPEEELTPAGGPENAAEYYEIEERPAEAATEADPVPRVVEEGDTLYGLSYGVLPPGATDEERREWVNRTAKENGLADTDRLAVGQRLVLPDASESEAPRGGRAVGVEGGDTLTSLAREELGEGATDGEVLAYADRIYRTNPTLSDPEEIDEGQRLLLPDADPSWSDAGGAWDEGKETGWGPAATDDYRYEAEEARAAEDLEDRVRAVRPDQAEIDERQAERRAVEDLVEGWGDDNLSPSRSAALDEAYTTEEERAAEEAASAPPGPGAWWSDARWTEGTRALAELDERQALASVDPDLPLTEEQRRALANADPASLTEDQRLALAADIEAFYAADPVPVGGDYYDYAADGDLWNGPPEGGSGINLEVPPGSPTDNRIVGLLLGVANAATQGAVSGWTAQQRHVGIGAQVARQEPTTSRAADRLRGEHVDAAGGSTGRHGRAAGGDSGRRGSGGGESREGLPRCNIRVGIGAHLRGQSRPGPGSGTGGA